MSRFRKCTIAPKSSKNWNEYGRSPHYMHTKMFAFISGNTDEISTQKFINWSFKYY